MKRLIIVGVFLSSALIAGMGYNMPSFSYFDVDNNSKITQSEFENGREKRMTEKAKAGMMMRNAGNAASFKDIDTNNDGEIDVAEFSNHQKMEMSKNRGGGMGMGQGGNKK